MFFYLVFLYSFSFPVLCVCSFLPPFSLRLLHFKGKCSPECQNAGTCMPKNKCSCRQGYTGDHCQTAVCPDTCLNGGKCIKPYICLCNRQWYGERCEYPVCILPCLNGGRCVSPNKCSCRSGYKGRMCHIGE